MKGYLPAIIGISIVVLVASAFLIYSKNTFAAADHIVISEIQIEGGSTTDEFVELYNPTDVDQDISGWTLYRKTGSGTEEIIVATASGSIPAHGFYLFANENFDGGASPDTSYTENISDNNSMILRNSNEELIDLIGMSSSLTNETATIDNPIDNRSLERKANSASTEESMASGGIDELNGNGEDTDNNSVDFVRHIAPNFSKPQNTNSDVEPVLTSPTPTLSPSPEPSLTPEPTAEPTATPSPSPEPTEEPTPTPTIQPTPTIVPTVTPTPTDGPKIFSSNPIITCTVNYKGIRVFGKTFYFPLITCFRTMR